MEVEKICSLVKAAWIFNKKNYPTYLRFTPVQQQVFALNHVLKHQAKAHNILSRGTRRRSEIQYAIQKVLFNSIRFATLLGMETETIATLLGMERAGFRGETITRI